MRNTIRKEDIKDKLKAALAKNKFQKARLRQFRQVTRKDRDALMQRCEKLYMDDFERGRSRPKKYCKKMIKQDMKQFYLTNDMTLDSSVCST